MKFIKFWFPVLAYSGIIFYISSWPSVRMPEVISFDKVLHVFEYIPFGYLVARALYNTKQTITLRSVFWMAFLFSVLYGLSDEYHQSFVEGRYSSLFDVIADSIGGMIGGYCFGWFKKRSSAK